MATVEAKLRAGLLAVFLLMYAVRATTSAELTYVAYRGDDSGTAEPIGMRSRCGSYPYTVVRKLIPCQSLRFPFRLAPPPPEKSHQVSQPDKAPPPQST